MFKILSYLFPVIVFINCSANNANKKPAERDTTINEVNAYSSLFLDSTELAHFLTQQDLPEEVRNNIRDFYNRRNYNYAWFNEDGLTLQAEGFWNAQNDYFRLTNDSALYNKGLHNIMDTLLYNADNNHLTPSLISKTELELTRHFFTYTATAYKDKANPEDLQWYIPKRKLNPSALLDSLLTIESGEWKPLSKDYHALHDKILQYRKIENAGGWNKLPTAKRKIKPGTTNSIISQVKQRMASEGLFTLAADTSNVYTPALETAIRQAQKQYGLDDDGVIDNTLIEKLNVPVLQRIKQMMVNLERMMWMPSMPKHHITVNIPDYKLLVVEDEEQVMSMNVVVGKAANRTVIFSDELAYVVFSPYWNLPSSIVRNEILPAMRNNSNYLNSKNMEVVKYREDGLPVIRQLPGPGNALGKVKFIFPNSYAIYFHDTPSKSLFNRDKRAFSHGCIRVQEPFELARYLLRNQTAWTDSRIIDAMNQQKEKWVQLNEKVPVFITYFTSWVDSEGNLNFRNDLYGHDDRLAKQLFE